MQDHFLVKMLKDAPTICDFHGSDLRYTLKTKWGWIVRRNLETADKVLISVPDVVEIAKLYRADAEYLPNPVDLQLFKPAQLSKSEILKVLLASDLSFVKGVDEFITSFAEFQRAYPKSVLKVIDYGKDRRQIKFLLGKLGVKYEILPKQPHHLMEELYHKADIVTSDFALGYLQMTSLEAMACHRPVIQFINKRYYARSNLPPVPLASTHREIIESLLLLTDSAKREEIATKQERYVRIHHNPEEISRRVIKIYDELLIG